MERELIREPVPARRADDGSISLSTRLERIEKGQTDAAMKIEQLEGRINLLFGGLAVLVSIVNIVGPIIDSFFKAKP